MHGAAKEAVDPATLSVAMQARREARKEAAAERREGERSRVTTRIGRRRRCFVPSPSLFSSPFSKQRTTETDALS